MGFFSFFSSTNIETKNVCPIAYNDGINEVGLKSNKQQLTTKSENSTPINKSTKSNFVNLTVIKKMEKIKVKICCPECLEIQDAYIEKTFPFYTYLHYCIKCDYLIMESEFNIVTKCKYCGIFTAQSDDECYRNPNQNLLFQIIESIINWLRTKNKSK